MEQDRACIRSHKALVAVFAATFLTGPALAQGTAPDLSGTWWATQYNAKVQIVGGGELPLTSKGKEAYEKNMAGLKDGKVSDDARKICTPDGPVRSFATPYPFEIFQAPPGQIEPLAGAGYVGQDERALGPEEVEGQGLQA